MSIRTSNQARPLLLAATGREPPDAATVWKHGGADRLAALASRVGEPTTGSDFREERGRGAAKCRKHGSKEGLVASFGILARGTNGTFRGPRKHLALQTRLRVALGGCQEYLLGRRKVDNGNSH